MRDELVELLEAAGVEQQLDALARGELARLVLLAHAVGAAAFLGAALQFREYVPARRHTRAACAFSQSFRKRSRPMSVSG